MKFYTFGDRENPAILLLPGTCCHWKRNFGAVIPLLKRDFHVICASYDGLDETENTVFPDMLEEKQSVLFRSDYADGNGYRRSRHAGTRLLCRQNGRNV